MVKAELLGRHSFQYRTGRHVHVWRRGEQFLLRGRLDGRAFGETLGRDEASAEQRLIQMLAELTHGTYRPPRHPSRKVRPRQVPSTQTIRDIVDAHVAERRRLRGMKTSRRYRDLLAHVLSFASQSEIRLRYPLAKSIDRDFAIGLKEFLTCREVSRNGRHGASRRRMASRSVVDILQRFRAALRFACRPDVGLLPMDFLIPLDDDIIGRIPAKDPIRSVALSMEQRIRLVQCMDPWQFTHLTPFLVLPIRPGELAGLLIGEVGWDSQYLGFGTRFGGNDFTKGLQSFVLPFPDELRSIFCGAIGDRNAGPVFLSRVVVQGRRKLELNPSSNGEFKDHVFKALGKAKTSTPQDAKVVIRDVIRKAGGVTPDALNREFKRLVVTAGIDTKISIYRCREIVTTEYERANMPMLARRYFTGHATGDILNEYTAFGVDDLRDAMQLHWDRIRPLLATIVERAAVFDLQCRGDVA